jgi:two-component system chemotaxis response regulator CheV
MSSVDSRTKLAGHNRLELLIFGLAADQRFGINVFKVREVIRCPKLTDVPKAASSVRGIADVRGHTITIIDLSDAIGGPRMSPEEVKDAFVIITEYNWKEVMPPPSGTNTSNFLTAVARVDKTLVEIIDVEQIFSKVVGVREEISADVLQQVSGLASKNSIAVVADDSLVARNQVRNTLKQMGLDAVVANNGKEAYDILHRWAEESPEQLDRIALVISDIEMPIMDGYALTTQIRRDPRLKSLYVILHSSLSGVFNEKMVEAVGADRFIAKFHPDDLAKVVAEALRTRPEHMVEPE